ncbi:TIGR02569 family protein [Nonomuraea antimicrobica]|uniref:TIGR02569 family protein n=2 Tax=Nonomuraea antimicrobica TaxID=561173 RepID=A0ABP7D171_9ACTN
MTEPPAGVLAAFRLTGAVHPLAGGQGQSFRAGNAVLKPVDDAEEAEWSAEVFAGLAPSAEFRVPQPCRADDGSHVVAGWAAYEFVAGRAGPAGEWATLIAAGRAFHQALRHLPRPGLLDRRRHPWAVADRIAWDEIGPVALAHTDGLLTTLRALKRPVDTPSQLVHGDLTGNVLLQSGQPPAVIDFSPYWRPVGYAEAIVVADGLLYHDAAPALINSTLPSHDGLQMLVRALIFRLSTSALLEGPGKTIPQEELTRFARVTGLLKERFPADADTGT